jgi:Holliday junction resolvase RusA-like endonuclease
MAESSRSLRAQYDGRALEQPTDADASPMDLIECARLGKTWPELQRLRAAANGAARKDTRATVRAGRVKGGGYSLGVIPGLDSPAMAIVRPAAVSLSLPWSTLMPDNNRHCIVMTEGSPRILTTQEYRARKKRAREQLEAQLGDGWRAIAVPVRVRLELIEPNRTAKRDILNYQKLVCDAMTGLVYVDDSLIDDAHWKRGAVDIDRPRAEITVSPLGA